MTSRRSPAPDIAGCILLLVAATLFFAVLHAIYSTREVSVALLRAGGYGGLLLLFAFTARGLFLRRPWASPFAVLLLIGLFLCGLLGFHVPETAQLPAGILGVLGTALLGLSRGEFIPVGADPARAEA